MLHDCITCNINVDCKSLVRMNYKIARPICFATSFSRASIFPHLQSQLFSIAKIVSVDALQIKSHYGIIMQKAGMQGLVQCEGLLQRLNCSVFHE